eukprot:2081998-Prymnesium_polylepis.1
MNRSVLCERAVKGKHCSHHKGYYRTRRKALCPIRTGRHVSPGRWGCVCVCIMLVCKCEPVPTCHAISQ